MQKSRGDNRSQATVNENTGHRRHNPVTTKIGWIIFMSHKENKKITKYSASFDRIWKKKKVAPGIEPGLPESESGVITITLHNHVTYKILSLKMLCIRKTSGH